MNLKESLHKTIRLLTLNQPMDVTDEEWDAVLDERRAEEERRSAWRQYEVDHYRETPEYRSAGWFKRLVMSIYYGVFLDCRGESGTPAHDDSMQPTELLDVLGEEAESLARMTHDERLAYFRRMDQFAGLTFDVDCGSTVIHVRTAFDGITDETVAETVRRTAEHIQPGQ